MRNRNTRPKGTIAVLTLFFLSIAFTLINSQPSSVAQTSAEGQPAASELIADSGGVRSRADGPDVTPMSDVAHAQMPASPQSEFFALLLLGSSLLLVATGIQLLASRKNKPKSKPA
ncbi:MAG TPA: hypothetical protein VE262_09560 [Blastocatellia bacterium]|nr:hypothetical protein [Blastocatellia bacterium]